MKLRRWVCSSLAAIVCTAAGAVPVEPSRAEVIDSTQTEAPAVDDPRWREVPLPDVQDGPAAWYRVRFDAGAQTGFWMVYLPYFYGGGRLWLNGAPVAAVPENTPALRVRWERPLLLPLPAGALQPQGNVLLIRAAAAFRGNQTMLPRLVLGPQVELQRMADRRLLVVRVVPVITIASGLVVGLLVLLIWWRRRQEVLYGLFGLATLLWALRTTTFAFDTLPAALWDPWRLLYVTCTGGFVIVMTLFALALAGWSRPIVTRALFGYWALGPLAFVLGGEDLANRWWVAGLIPIGLAMAVVTLLAAWRQRTGATIAIAAAVLLAFLAGVHDYLVAWNSPVLGALFPHWTDHRIFLLHHGANLLLVVMGVLLAMRFVRTLAEVEASNRTLEVRVAQREREIATSYQRIAALQREQAATDERQRIMRDLHDGLGAQLFTSLSRAERGALDSAAMSDTLRGAIDQMRIALEALASDEQDFRAAFGNFRFRWDPRLREAGLATSWRIDLPDSALTIAPHDTLQVLHIAQEALTNVLKHARATRVTVRLHREAEPDALVLDIVDDGGGGGEASRPAAAGGRGQANMRARAQRLGGSLVLQSDARGTRVGLRVPLRDEA